MGIIKSTGQSPNGKSAELFSRYSNFRSGVFRNQSETIMMAGDTGFAGMLWKFINKPGNCYPPGPLPVVKTNLQEIHAGPGQQPVIVWFGHSSYLIYINGIRVLVDPVFSGHASPFSFMARSFAGTNAYGVQDLPDIDVLIVTHDHYDHLDHQTILRLKSKTRLACVSLGVGSHLRYWGWEEKKILELGWGDFAQTDDQTRITATPARHFSGRTFDRNRTLWSSFVLQSGGYRFFIGGDSGYDDHFRQIGEQYGPFDLVLLESGQYNEAWPQIHMMPEDTVQAAIDLGARLLLAVHWGKFSLALHDWKEPIQRISRAAVERMLPFTAPRIGEPVIPGIHQPTDNWWDRL